VRATVASVGVGGARVAARVYSVFRTRQLLRVS